MGKLNEWMKGYIYIYIFVFQIKIKDLCCLVLLLFSLLLEINSTSPNDFCDSILCVKRSNSSQTEKRKLSLEMDLEELLMIIVMKKNE